MLPPTIKDSPLTNLDPGMAKDPSPKLLPKAETGTYSYHVNQKVLYQALFDVLRARNR